MFTCAREDIIGCLLTKDLILINPSDALPITSRTLREVPYLSADAPMFDALNLFQVHLLILFLHLKNILHVAAHGLCIASCVHIQQSHYDFRDDNIK